MSAKALLSASVSAPPAVYVEDVFSTYLYTGTGSTQTITNGIDLAGEGGLVWIKPRASSAIGHSLFDTNRGVSKFVQSNNTSATQDYPGYGVTSFGSSGFTVFDTSTGDFGVNGSSGYGGAYASWTFRKAEKFFDVVTWTGNGSNRTISHSLGSAPAFMIIKKTSGAEDWICYHGTLGILSLNSTASSFTNSTYWNNTVPTSSVFSLGTSTGVNESGSTYVAYLFASDAGGFGDSGNESVVSCGSLTADGSGNATVTLGWEPQWVLFKRSDNSLGGSWFLVDNMRGMPVSGNARRFLAESSAAEANFGSLYPTATGFASTAGNLQASGTYIYIAIRRGPMKTPTVATEVLESVAYTGDGSSNRTIGSSLTPDFVLWMDRDATSTAWSSHAQGIWDRIRGEDALLSTSDSNQESPGWANLYFNLDQQVGWSNGTNSVYTNNSGTDYVTHHFRRAPGFFDVVGSSDFSNGTPITHNLKATPELILVKARNTVSAWMGAISEAGNIRNLSINTTSGGYLPGLVYSSYFNSTTIDPAGINNGAGGSSKGSGVNIVSYLFATLAGVSKVGSYTGTGTTLSIDCGFTAGARFVLIKRTDSTGDWYVWDTARGIISGDDPYLLLNSTAAEVTNTDYIDPLSSGFQISSAAPAAINASGGSFIFLAIA